MKRPDPAALEWHIPPVCQGQAVTYAYAVDPEADGPACIIRCTTRHDAPDTFERFIDPEWAADYSSNLEFWNDEPKLGACVDTWGPEAVGLLACRPT